MDYHKRPKRWAYAGLRWKPPKWSLFMVFILVGGIAAVFIESATSQHIPDLNTPPILYVPDRNWRISETEQVGQIIARVRAEDAENDELVFGLEPHFHSNYANPGDEDGNGGGVSGGLTKDKLPFRIDPVDGVVYLNESLVGRAGENFFLYITVSDGQLTAKNEIFVNILGRKNSNSRTPPSITNVVQNISQILPAFDTLPGVQSIRNQLPNRRPSNSLPPGFGMNPSIYTPARPSYGTVDVGGGNFGFPAVLNFNPSTNNHNNKNQQLPIWPTTSDVDSDENENDNDMNVLEKQRHKTPTTTVSPTATATTSRTKLSPINEKKDHRQNSTTTPKNGGSLGETKLSNDSGMSNSTNAFSLKATIIPVIIAVSGVFVAVVLIFGYLYRKRLCAISKTLKKKSKEEMAKKSNQSNLSSNLTDDSRNSMVMQHWNGPTAFGNRYVPWERDQQMMQQSMATSQLSTSVANGAILPGDAATPGGMGMGGPISNSNVNGGSGLNNGNGHSLGVSGVGGIGANGAGGSAMTPGCGNNTQNKYDRWEFPRHRLKFFNILGEGAFGQVWRCEATDIDGVDGITTVAVKTLKENAAEIEKNDLVSELQVMKSLEPHTNVVRLLGCCTDKDPLFVIIEYVNRGKLQTFLRNSRAERHYGNTHGKSNILTSGDLTSFMYQVAKGMDYLTSRGIIHRDLAARNILITDDHTCKVADFGFARDVITSKIYERKSEGKLPIRWMAIESLYDNIFSVKSDIWSFGILMWEIVTLGSTPYPGISASDVMRKVRDGYRLEKPEHCRRELYNIMYYCWSKDANERPIFSEIVQMLDKLLHTEMDYIELERFPDHNYYNILNLSGEKL